MITLNSSSISLVHFPFSHTIPPPLFSSFSHRSPKCPNLSILTLTTRNSIPPSASHAKKEDAVNCEVQVISWRERKIKAHITVYTDLLPLWTALTDYERLADFIPNLVSSGTIPCPHPGRIWLEQRGFQRALYWHIEARVVLDLQEFPISATNHELHFSMVDGDFKKFEGKWSLISGTRPGTTILAYELSVIPRFNFPTIFLERIISSDLPVNLQAVACRAERQFGVNHKTSVAGSESSIAASTSPSIELNGAVHEKNTLSTRDLKEIYPSSNLGPTPSSELNTTWGVFGKVCRLDRPCIVDEVHLRRFDGLLENGGVHRCVVGSITVKAPVREVWKVLTAYESLPEIVPNLVISKIVSRENNKVRILQEGCKGLLYMVLHARVVLDLCENLEQEISFQQVEGDFNSFEGRWLLEQLGSHHTLLKYSVESKMHKDTFLPEAIMEEVIYEDLPSNLCAIRDYIEKREVTDSLKMQDMKEYSNELVASNGDSGTGNGKEIDKEHGQEGFMPMRKQLRLHGRVDIEKAITRMGGVRRIASIMNLSLAYKGRKPKGYWDNLENLQEEISRFQRSWGMDPSYMPSRKSFERAGRYDIARALEKWGGLHEVSRLLTLKVRHPNRQPNANGSKDKKIDEPIASKNYVSQDTQKWLTNLKDLDFNWVD
ncbi:Polyketide cyclase / dehydrase and lipid transport protein [Euphorbia peplus]|nr:Polyketide cyclase / dehydrase and lipid transport protein [Euphorbia peplus]